MTDEKRPDTSHEFVLTHNPARVDWEDCYMVAFRQLIPVMEIYSITEIKGFCETARILADEAMVQIKRHREFKDQ